MQPSPTQPSPTQAKLIGSVTVQPTSVQPGQPVLVQVCDTSGKPISDPTINVIIQGVLGSSRYFQFPTVGPRTLSIRACQGSITDTAQATVTVAGAPMAFRVALTSSVTEMPIIQISSVLGQPYAAAFSLGNPTSVSQALAAAVNKSNAANPAPKVAPATSAPAAAPPAASDALGIELGKVLTTLPAAQVTKIAPVSAKTGATTTATLSGVSAPAVALTTPAQATSYAWNFGDGQTATTQSPDVTHDFSASIQADDITRSFDITCTVVHDNVTVKRTLVLHSAYGMCKQLGVSAPRVTGTANATFQQVAFSASLTVYNIEAAPITLSSMACVPLSDSTAYTPPAPKFTTMENQVTIAAKSATAIGVYIPVAELQVAGAQITSFAVYYSGTMALAGGKTMPVRFSYIFRIPLAAQWAVNLPASSIAPASNWNLSGVLKAVGSLVAQPNAMISKAGTQVLDPATRTLAIPLTANASDIATQAQVQAAVQAGLTSVALEAGALTTKRVATPLSGGAAGAGTGAVMLDETYNPLSPPPVAVGNECYPDDISDADAATANANGLICQLTTQVETVTVPAAFQNAQQGDIILSPAPVGSGDMIAAMFRALSPPQHHGHSGIMTANFYEITHCTASPDRISSNVNKDLVGIPTSLNAGMLQYAWPGSLTQSIDDAISLKYYIDPNGNSYPLQSFNTDSEGQGYEVIPPLVVKPLPENEAAARPALRKAADIARSKGAQYDSTGKQTSKGGCYYYFYCFTNPQISAGFGDVAGSEAGWAQGMSPAVCSSFVWLCLKEGGVPLVTTSQYETLANFSPAAVAGGAEVGPATLDGLIFYPAAERLAGANALYAIFMEQALDQEGWIGTIPGADQAIAGPIADQLLNVFASGNANLPGSNAWQNPGDGNAVSPDNIIFWNPPYYGYAEPLQYLPQHTEQYTVSQWVKKPATSGSVKGVVTLNGSPVPNAHVWVYLPGGDTYTGADGSYTLSNIPVGPYSLKAQGVVTTNGISVEYTNGQDGQSIALSSGSPNITLNIGLQDNPVPYRRLDMTYSISCDHGDANPFNKHGVQTAGPFTRSMDVNPGKLTNSLTYTFDYNGGGYFHINYVFSIALLPDYSIEVTLIGTMYDDNSPPHLQTRYALPPFKVPIGATHSGRTVMENANAYHNGPAIFTFSVVNNKQTG